MSEIARLDRPHDGVGLVTLDLSAYDGHTSWAAVDALAAALTEARESGARVVVLASEMEGHWYEHAWLPDLINMVEGEPTSGGPAGWFQALNEITATDVVSIAAITGDCSGGGAELGWACDLRIAEEQAHFSQPEVMLGVGTGIGGTSRLMRLIGRTVTAEMVLDGGPISAERIYQLGGVNRVVPQGQGIGEAVAWAARLAERPPGALATLKQMLRDAQNRHLDEALGNEQALFQKSAHGEEGKQGMKRVQERFASGESIRDVYGPPRR
jgi:enoyl-CoA hydratase/carnithine racemase